MGYLAVCRAIYAYAAQNGTELDIKEGDLLFIVDKTNEEGEEDEWWRAKKKAADDEEDEPEGLIPNNYVEEAKPLSTAKALYEYTRQTEEELSFPEEAQLAIYDTTDPDWTLVGYNNEFGFVPANYIEAGGISKAAPATAARSVLPPPQHQEEEEEEEEDVPPPQPPRPGSLEVAAPTPAPAASGPAASLASIMGGRAPPAPPMPSRLEEVPSSLTTRHVQFTPEPEEIPPPMPARPARGSPPPPSESPRSPSPPGVMASPPIRSPSISSPNAQSPQIRSNTFEKMGVGQGARPGGYHLYNISEMVSVMGKQKKMPVTLGINLGTGMIFLSPEKKRDGPQQEWTADKLEHYSIEGKHVFLELKKPSKSLDLHAGAKDTATEIVSALGELAGAARLGGGLDEIFDATAGSGSKRGHMLYDFVAQGDDEVDVAEGDAVVVLDDHTTEEWWKVRRIKNGKEGVVPSSYVEISSGPEPPPKDNGVPRHASGRSNVEQNRRDEERSTREAVKRDEERRRQEAEVGPGMRLPKRASSLLGARVPDPLSSQRSKRESHASGSRDWKAKTKPDLSKVRNWTDRSGTFNVEAQFLGLKDGKIQLHKLNGVKIAVPVDRMSTKDLNYVESVTGLSLDEDKPLSDLRGNNGRGGSRKQKERSNAGASVEPRIEYDWFDFFLACSINPQLCERYAQSFARDNMDENSQEDITPELLRTLGLKEGDILKVMKFLDTKYDRKSKAKGVSFEEGANGEGSGLLAGPGGVIKNNTGKGRPAPPVSTNNVVDGGALGGKRSVSGGDRAPTPPQKDGPGGSFDDNAWDVKPSRSEPAKPVEKAKSPPPAAPAVAAPPKPPPTGVNSDLAGLSLLDTPLQPQVTHNDGARPAPTPTPSFAPPPSQQLQQAQQIAPQPTGATPQFFQNLPVQQTGIPQQVGQGIPQPQSLGYQQTGLQPLQPQPTALQQPLALSGARSRPQAPSQPQFNNQGQLIPPPPARPGSAPQQFSPQDTFAPPPLQAQLTGAPNVTFNPNANPAASLADMQRMRLQQQMTAQPIQAQPTGFQPNQYMQPLQPQMTAMPGYLQAQPTASPFSDMNRMASPPQMTGFQTPLQVQQTGMNGGLMPALQPQQTGMNGFGGYGQQIAPPVPQIPQQYQQTGQSAPFQPQSQFGQQQQGGNQTGLQPPAQALVPQKTGPAPPVSFGMDAVKKLTPQPTGRANLAKATPQNPFGF